MNVKGKTVLVTGAANGIGLCIVQDLLKHDAKSVAIFDLPTSNGENVTKELEAEFGKGRVVFFPCDVTNDEEFRSNFKKVIESLGVPDILVNSAGIFNEVKWERMIDVNFTATVRSSLMFLDHVGKHNGGKGGVIVNIASIAALMACKSNTTYTATKYAVLGFSRSLDRSYDETGVCVLTVCPGLTKTSIIDFKEEQFLNFIDGAEVLARLQSAYAQPPQNVSRAVIELIETGKSGTVYVSENNEPPFPIEFPDYHTLRKPRSA